jgi:hypothetical protein
MSYGCPEYETSRPTVVDCMLYFMSNRNLIIRMIIHLVGISRTKSTFIVAFKDVNIEPFH